MTPPTGGGDIPDAVFKLVEFDSDPTDVHTDLHTCRFHIHGLELRFQRGVDDQWDFDEIVGPCRLHIEQMSDVSYWIGIDGDGGRICVDIGSASGRAEVRMTGWTERDG